MAPVRAPEDLQAAMVTTQRHPIEEIFMTRQNIDAIAVDQP
jgi:hypothetical protein